MGLHELRRALAVEVANATSKQEWRPSEHSVGRRFVMARIVLSDGLLAPHQRSYQSRRGGTICDVGAFEVQP